MSDRSLIEWTDATWNPVTGCTPVTPGCIHCYAWRFAERFRGVPGHTFERGFDLQLRPERLELPKRWKRPRRVFVDSMGDLFHPCVPFMWLADVFRTMGDCHWHTFQVLTKRAERAARCARALPWHDNIWMGVTVEDQQHLGRLDALREVPARVRFVSFEPLLEPVGLPNLAGIHWVIVGGENGPGARPMREEWVLELRDYVVGAGIPFFFKGWGGRRRYDTNIAGRPWREFPA